MLLKRAIERHQQVIYSQPGGNLNGTSNLGLPAELKARPGFAPSYIGTTMQRDESGGEYER
jgi:hypothetical protein